MKRGISILFFTIIFCLAGKAQNLVGSWKTIINNDEIGFIFDSLGYATMNGEGETIGGRNVFDGWQKILHEIQYQFICKALQIRYDTI
jgi:hypothetical protein